MRALAIALCALLAASVAGCAGRVPVVTDAQEIIAAAETPEQTFYAVAEVFKQTAEVATNYAESPSATVSEIRAIRDAIQRGRDVIATAEQAAVYRTECLAAGQAPEICNAAVDYTAWLTALRLARAELVRFTDGATHE